MKKRLINFLKVSFATCIILTAFIISYIGIICIDLPSKTFFQQKITSNQAWKSDKQFNILPVLEEGSVVRREELDAYYLASKKDFGIKEWYKEKFSDGTFKKLGKDKLYVEKDTRLGSLLNNNCSAAYCYQHMVSFSKLPSILWKGLIGIEDARFISHIGVDPKSILRAIITDIKHMKFVQGGSTLTQQLVKNLFLTNEKTISRKIKELVFSIYIESTFSKEDILEAYFNEVYWGSLQGIRIKGVYSASLFYFGVTPKDLTPYQAAILISLLKGPGYYGPLHRLERLKIRTKIVYNKLVDMNLFVGGADSKWSEQDWANWHRLLVKRDLSRPYRNLWNIKKSGDSLNQYQQFVFLNSAKSLLKKIKNRLGSEKDISVKAYISSIRNENSPFLFYSKEERNLNIALTSERHQVGSTLKPIIFSIYRDSGKSLQDAVSTEKITLNLNSGKWSPREAHKIIPKKVKLIDSLLRSYNRPTIRIASELGFDKIEVELKKYLNNLKSPLKEYPAQLLGSVELSLAELYNIYASFIRKEASYGNDDNDIINNNLIYLLSDPNKTTIRKVVKGPLKQLRFFGKTGTSNNGYDNWYVFFDGSTLGIIWVGYEGRRTGKNLNIYGGTTAFKIFQDYFLNSGKRFYDLSPLTIKSINDK